MTHWTRRNFLTGSAAAGATALSASARAATNKNSKLRLFQIGVGGIGKLDRRMLEKHPQVEFAGFCDVDRTAFDLLDETHAGAWRIADYREAFADKLDDFDAVIVDSPDFHHCPMMVTALKHGKHVYGQKPLVQELEELRILREAVAARPDAVTQMGNQRSCLPGRMEAVEILKSNQLGKPIEAHIWLTSSENAGTFFTDPWVEMTPAQPIPETMSWDLWNGPFLEPLPYSDDLHPKRWRSFWATGGGMLSDWGCHVIDVLYYAYGLTHPLTVQTDTLKPALVSHSGHNRSTMTYAGGDRFAKDRFVLYFSDSGLTPSFSALGIPRPKLADRTATLVVCEEGVLVLAPSGKYEIYRNGKLVEAEVESKKGQGRNHWRDWVECCLGKKKPLWSPFEIGSRITEPGMLAVKATRFPNQELHWDAENYRFTNHEEANQTILSRPNRAYREGFAPPPMS